MRKESEISNGGTNQFQTIDVQKRKSEPTEFMNSSAKDPISYLVTTSTLISCDNTNEVDESVYWICASSSDDAYFKGVEIGSRCERACNDAFSKTFRFLGVVEIMPVYEYPTDGAQLGWRKFEDPDINEMMSKVIVK